MSAPESSQLQTKATQLEKLNDCYDDLLLGRPLFILAHACLLNQWFKMETVIDNTTRILDSVN